MIWFFSVVLLLTIALLVVFYLEDKRGERFFSNLRAGLDKRLFRLVIIFRNIHIGRYLSELSIAIAKIIEHRVTAITLFFVRGIERNLTKRIRTIRRNTPVNGSSGSEYIEAIREAKSKAREDL